MNPAQIQTTPLSVEYKSTELAVRLSQDIRFQGVHNVEQYTEENKQVDTVNTTSYNFQSSTVAEPIRITQVYARVVCLCVLASDLLDVC